MEKLVDVFLTFPPPQNLSDQEFNKQAATLINTLNKTPASTLASNSNGTDLLTILNPTANSLVYLYVLIARLDLGGRNALEATWKNAVLFLENFDSRQIRNAPDMFRRLFEAFYAHAVDSQKPLIAVRPIKKAIIRYNPSRFSFMHTSFLRLCLMTKCYRDAAAVLDIDLVEFPYVKNKPGETENMSNSRKEVTYQDLLCYFLYGGMIYMGLKEWRRAADLLTYVVACPGNACSLIQVEAYKKYILVGLLLDGKPLPMPKVTSAAAVRAYKALTKPYDAFAQAFKSGSTEMFRTEAALLSDVFRQDGNTGLAVQCMDVFRRMQIVALRDTYVTLSIEEISKKNLEVVGRGGDAGGKEETEGVVLGMIERDEIRASLSQSEPDYKLSQTTVHFHNNPLSELRNLRALDSQISRTISLTKQVKAMDRKLGLSKEYIQWANRLAKMAGGGSSLLSMGDPDAMDFDYGGGWADDEPEETIMQDFDDEI